MNAKTRPHKIIDLSSERRVWLNILDLPRLTLPMYGLLEVDVTVPRRFIAEHKNRTGESLSFTGYLTLCLARAVEENKTIQDYRKGNRQLIQFDQVDVGLMVEKQIGENQTLTGYVIRDASQKTFRQIHEEIRMVQSNYVEPSKDVPRWFLTLMLLPWPFSSFVNWVFAWLIRRNPAIAISMTGTVGITAVGMFGRGQSGWGFEATRHSLALVVGSSTLKPAIVDGQVAPREILNLTVIFDHHVVDGAPAARFTRRMVELIESGYGLEEMNDHLNSAM